VAFFEVVRAHTYMTSQRNQTPWKFLNLSSHEMILVKFPRKMSKIAQPSNYQKYLSRLNFQIFVTAFLRLHKISFSHKKSLCAVLIWDQGDFLCVLYTFSSLQACTFSWISREVSCWRRWYINKLKITERKETTAERNL
jgi:hypothetical protein